MEYKDLDKEEFAELYPRTKNLELAQKYGVSQKTLTSWASILGVKKFDWHFTKVEEEFILHHYKVDMTAQEIGEKYGRTKWSIQNKYRDLMLTKKTPRKKRAKAKGMKQINEAEFREGFRNHLLKVVAKNHGISLSRAKTLASKLNLNEPPKRFTDQEKKIMDDGIKNGEKLSMIAAKINVSYDSVFQYKKRKLK